MLIWYVLIAMMWFAYILGQRNKSEFLAATNSPPAYVVAALIISSVWPIVFFAITWNLIKGVFSRDHK